MPSQQCPDHSRNCLLEQKSCAFLFFLYLLVDFKDNQDDDESKFSNVGVSLLRDILKEPNDPEELLNTKVEKKESANLDVAKF